MMQTVTTMTWSLSPILMTITFADPPAFFYLEHASKYQDADRIKIRELWVPAAAIIEDGCKDEDRIIRAEARHRLRSGKGIRVFSRPDKLKDWLNDQGLTLESRAHLITDAGQLTRWSSAKGGPRTARYHSLLRNLLASAQKASGPNQCRYLPYREHFQNPRPKSL